MLVQVEVLVVWYEFHWSIKDPALIAQPQSSTNQLAPKALSHDHQIMVTRLDLFWESEFRLIAFKCYMQLCVCRSKSSFRDDNNLHASISVLGEAFVWQQKLILGST